MTTAVDVQSAVQLACDTADQLAGQPTRAQQVKTLNDKLAALQTQLDAANAMIANARKALGV